MPAASDSIGRVHLFDQTVQELKFALSAWKWPAYRADQILNWVYGKLVTDPAVMTTLSERDREVLRERMVIASAELARRQDSNDGTIKLLLTWPDGRNAETVMIPDGERRTACVSSQVGCPVGCTFCASGVGGLKGNLSAGQIVEQVFTLNRILAERGGRITNVVFMGMGEPLANYANATKSMRILHGAKGFHLGARRMTISTVGVPERIRELAGEGLAINLALSLHAPNEALRRELIPWAEHFALDEILKATRFYFERTGREITLEYILLAGVNDRPEHARQLSHLCRGMRANINLIRYNEVAGMPFRRPKAEDVVRFQGILREAGLNAHVRKSRGRDIDAACGQLRRRGQEEGNLVQIGVNK